MGIPASQHHALHAAVEAARAGAQGRGLAVLASEVRSAINTLIATRVERVEHGAVLVDQIGRQPSCSMRKLLSLK